MNVGIIIPSFNHFDYVHLAVESAAKTPGAIVIIMDDASPKWPGDRVVRGYLPQNIPFVVQRYDTNAGLSRSWNAGLRICRNLGLPYAVCGNSDLVFSNGWWEPIKQALQSHDFAGPITNAPGHVGAQNVTRQLADYELSDDPDDIDMTAQRLRKNAAPPESRSLINGFCIAGRTASFFDVAKEPFDSTIPMAGNEDDFFERAKSKGMSSCFVPQSFVFHYRSVSRAFGKPKRKEGAMRLAGCGACQKQQ
jgi:GT2 family glycosyltransferase